MKELSIEEIEKKAELLNKEDKQWHFHMLTPNCMFNKKDKHAFVLENTSDSESFVFYSQERQMKSGKKLLQMLHGKEILGKKEQETSKEKIQIILKKAEEFNKRKILWHHHMLFPHCIFNKKIGKWNIVLEDKEKNKLLEASYDNEPKEDLNKVELLFYKQKK